MKEETMTERLPETIVERDHRLEKESEKVGAKLAELRWLWTLDETNPNRVSFRTYARAVGRSYAAVRNMATGYDLWRADNSGVISLSEAVERAKLSGEKESAVEAVAEARGIGFSQAAKTGEYRREASVVLETARERAERRGTSVEEEVVEVAEQRAKVRTSNERRTAERKERHTFRYVEVEGLLAGAKSRLAEALKTTTDVPFSDEETELLRSTISNLRSLLDLLDLRLGGATEVDWNEELRRLTEKEVTE